MSMIVKFLLVLVGVYVGVLGAAYFGQRKLIYFPDRTRVEPSQAGLPDVEEKVLKTPDGQRIIVWYGKAQPGQPTLLYFHGNGGGLVDRAERIRRFMNEGWGVYMMAYRGYSGSSGVPTEASNIADARLAYGALVLEGVSPESIIAYGESLGSGVAARVAVERPVGRLILEAPYTSAVAVGAKAYPYLPVSYLLRDRYETDKVIKQVHVPLLILHGERDGVIPVEMGRELARLANEPKRVVVFPNAGHNNLYVDGNQGMTAVRDWIRDVAPAAKPAG
jgi:fermentation-respiration switch protein FrsA (DUF1100 family)